MANRLLKFSEVLDDFNAFIEEQAKACDTPALVLTSSIVLRCKPTERAVKSAITRRKNRRDKWLSRQAENRTISKD